MTNIQFDGTFFTASTQFFQLWTIFLCYDCYTSSVFGLGMDSSRIHSLTEYGQSFFVSSKCQKEIGGALLGRVFYTLGGCQLVIVFISDVCE